MGVDGSILPFPSVVHQKGKGGGGGAAGGGRVGWGASRQPFLLPDLLWTERGRGEGGFAGKKRSSACVHYLFSKPACRRERGKGEN